MSPPLWGPHTLPSSTDTPTCAVLCPTRPFSHPGLPLDYDRELQTVGWSNFVSGCCGGYTGSYIFSQTIFTLRRGVTDDSRVCGWYAFVLRACGGFFCTLQLTRGGIHPRGVMPAGRLCSWRWWWWSPL
jgi:hypothetical protein